MGTHVIRVLLIILVAGLVSGGLYAFSQTSMAASITPQRGEHGPPPFLRGEEGGAYDRGAWPADREGHRSEGHRSEGREGGHHHRDGISVTDLLAGLGKDMGIIALVVLVVAAIQSVGGKVKGKPQRVARTSNG
jgi:hypothetical protein